MKWDETNIFVRRIKMKYIAIAVLILMSGLGACSTGETNVPVIAGRQGEQYLDFGDGIKYVGQVKDGKPHGMGTKTWIHGEYTGQWKDGKRHGQGTMIETDEIISKYAGQWQNDKRHGQGTETHSLNSFDNADSEYVGQFKDGRYHGQGTSYSFGIKTYEGQWENSMRHGLGTEYDQTGKISRKGRWERNDFLGSEP